MTNDATEIIEAMGGPAKTARFFGIKTSSVSEWKQKNEIPKARLHCLHLVRPDLFRPKKAKKS